MTRSSEPYGLYIHVPFCIRKCNYCDFYSLPYSEDLALEYGNALTDELNLIGSKYNTPQINTVYIGGGTPSLLPSRVLEQITNAIVKNFSFSNDEFTIEVNPATNVDFKFYKSIGINRISIGVQSLNDNVLKIIGRLHNSNTAMRTLESATAVFNNVSADLMLGLPDCSISQVTSDIDVLSRYVQHISAYILKLSNDVPMSRMLERGEITIPDEDLEADMYDAALERLEKNGLYRYEISNFARAGYESKHNLKYWNRVGYYAAGPAAHSFIAGVRHANSSSLTQYLQGKNVLTGHGETTHLTQEDALFESIMLSLRLPAGINIDRINKEFHMDFISQYAMQIKKLNEVMTFDGQNLYINKDKFLIESAIAREFLK